MKTLEKDRNRRYETAKDFAADVQRYLADEPVLACPPSALYRFGKFARRHKPALLTAALVSLALVLGTGVSSWQALRATAAEDLVRQSYVQVREEQKQTKAALDESEQARRKLEDALRQSATLALGQGQNLYEQGEAGRGLLWQARALGMTPKNSAALEWSIRLNLRTGGAALPPLRAVIDYQDDAGVQYWQFSPDGKVLAVMNDVRTARLWDTASGRPVGEPLRHPHPVHEMLFSADGKALLTVSQKRERQKRAADWEARLHLWQAATGKPLGAPIPHPDVVSRHAVAFSPDSKTVATATNGAVLLWDVATGKLRGQPVPQQPTVEFVAFSADSRLFVAASRVPKERPGWQLGAWDVATGKPLAEPVTSHDVARGGIGSLFSPDRKAVLAFLKDRQAQLHDLATGKPLGQPFPSPQAFGAVLFSPDGKVLMTLGTAAPEANTARLWDPATGKLLRSLPHSEPVQRWAFSPDGKQVLTVAADRTVRLWDATTGNRVGIPLLHRDPVDSVAYSPDGKVILTGCRDRTARLWEAASGAPLGPPLQHDGGVGQVAFSPDGRSFLSISSQGFGGRSRVRLWGLKGGPEHRAYSHADKARVLAFSPDGKTVLTGTPEHPNRPRLLNGEAQLWDLAGGKPLGNSVPHARPVDGGAFSPDGKTVATVAVFQREPRAEVQLWEAATGKLLTPVLTQDGAVLAPPAFSPDGRTLAVGDLDGNIRLWQTATGKLLQTLKPPAEAELKTIDRVAFSPDGRTLAVASWDKTVRLWEVASGKVRAVLAHPNSVMAVAFSPDGRILLTGCADNRARLWDLATQKEVGPPLEHRAAVGAVAFSPDGKLVATGSQHRQDRTARLWDAATGRPIGPPLPHPFSVLVVAFTPDGKALLTGSDVSRAWPVPAPLRGTAEQINLWAQVLTGMELDDYGAARWLGAHELEERRRRLEKAGGPPQR